MAGSKPFLDTNYFHFVYGDTSRGERMIDCQDWSATEYVSMTMNNDATVLGVNFADGRTKGYPKFDRRTRSSTPFDEHRVALSRWCGHGRELCCCTIWFPPLR